MGASFVAIRMGEDSRRAACFDQRTSQRSEGSSRPGNMSNQMVGAKSQGLGMPGERPLQLRVCVPVWFRQFLSPSGSAELREDGWLIGGDGRPGCAGMRRPGPRRRLAYSAGQMPSWSNRASMTVMIRRLNRVRRFTQYDTATLRTISILEASPERSSPDSPRGAHHLADRLAQSATRSPVADVVPARPLQVP